MKAHAWWVVLAVMLMTAGAQAQGIQIRLVEAGHRGQGIGPGLQDVAALLKSNTPYTSFRLLDSRVVAVPGGAPVTLGPGYVVRCEGALNNLMIRVNRGRQPVMNTSVSLRPGRPLILGGFPGGGGQLIFILVAR